jgi:predicted RNA-binding Zn-ribbon protein involved in translation (DUF1610 family)
MMGMSFSTRVPRDWVRGRAHVADGEIILDAGKAETYALRQLDNLPLDLASLDEGDPEQVVAFVRRYGLLWHGPDKLGKGTLELREYVQDWGHVVALLGNTINFYVDLRKTKKDDPRDTLRKSTSLFFAHAFMSSLAAEENQQWTDEDYVKLGNELLSAWLDYKIRSCTLGTVPTAEQDARDRPGQVLLAYHPSDLETAAYAELAMLIAGQQELRPCKGCGHWFLPTSSKNLYHAPNCSTITRQRKRRQRSREADAS